MAAEDGPVIDVYGWPQNEPAAPASAAELKIVSSILPAVDLAGLKLTHLATGQEHFVHTSSLPLYQDKVIKITRPGGYGIILDAKVGDARIDWRRATVREYLQRLHRQKRVLSDTVEILGTTLQQNDQGATVIAIVTAQKFRAGTPPSNEEIRGYMLSLGFAHVPEAMITLTYLKNFSFYSAVHNLLISDCRSANFVKADGGLAVIDVIVQRPKGLCANCCDAPSGSVWMADNCRSNWIGSSRPSRPAGRETSKRRNWLKTWAVLPRHSRRFASRRCVTCAAMPVTILRPRLRLPP